MTPELLMVVFMGVGLTLYTVLGGADFGAGVWEFNLLFRPSPEERDLIQRAMGPVWEANHVWLIFVVVVLFSAFPPVFAGISRALWLPLLLAVLGIVLRGTGFALRYYGSDIRRHRVLWGAVFAVASVMTPFFLGAAVGAVASGELSVTASGEFTGEYLTGWIGPLPIYMGFFTVGLCAYLAAVYLCRDAQREEGEAHVEAWRRRALGTGLGTGLLAMVGLVVVAFEVPRLWEGLVEHGWPLVLVSIVGGVSALAALWLRRFTIAALAAAVAVAAVVAAWLLAQAPLLLPPAITVESAKAPRAVLIVMAWSITVGGVLLAPSLAWLLYLFKGQPTGRNNHRG